MRYIVWDDVSMGMAGLAGWSVVRDTERGLTVSWHHKHAAAQRAADRLNAGKPPLKRSPRKPRTRASRRHVWRRR